MGAGVAYFGNRIVRHVAADMEALAARGFTGILHTFSENDLAFYRGTMSRIIDASHAAGLEVQVAPWAVCHAFGGEAESRFTAAHPEAGQVLDDGRRTAAGCLNDEHVRAFIRSWVDAAIDAGADRVFCDEPHWVQPEEFGLDAERWGCRCERCHALFLERFGQPMPTTLTPDVLAFRERCLVELIADFVAHAAARGARATVCLLPLTGGPHGIRDWSAVAGLPGLDTFGTDPYWKAFGRPVDAMVRETARNVVRLADEHGVRPQLWIQGFGLGAEDAADIRAAVAIARDERIDDLWTWGFEACANMSALAGSDPAAAWDVLCDAMLEGARA